MSVALVAVLTLVSPVPASRARLRGFDLESLEDADAV